jgi:hypothetical protein
MRKVYGKQDMSASTASITSLLLIGRQLSGVVCSFGHLRVTCRQLAAASCKSAVRDTTHRSTWHSRYEAIENRGRGHDWRGDLLDLQAPFAWKRANYPSTHVRQSQLARDSARAD